MPNYKPQVVSSSLLTRRLSVGMSALRWGAHVEGLKRGCTRLYHGDGAGKTTAALGVALRAFGHGLSVSVIHFLKGYEDVGEMHFAKLLAEIGLGDRWRARMFRHTPKPYIDLDMIQENMEEYKHAAWLAMREAWMAYLHSDVVVLDEITNAEASGALDLSVVLEIIKQRPYNVELILTGRMPHPRIVEMCDYVSEINKIKHPFDRGIWARKGIDY